MTMKLLIVEDSHAVSDRLRRIFAELPGVRVEAARTVRQGLEHWQAFRPEVVVLDLQLPDASGLDLLEQIKREEPATRVLIFSNHAFYRKRCLAGGADCFFDKSMDFDALLTTVRIFAEVRA